MENLKKEELEQIREAARSGAREGAKDISIPKTAGWPFYIMIILVLAVLAAVGYSAWNNYRSFAGIQSQLKKESEANSHDMVLEDHGIIGYKAADFADAMLGDRSKLSKLEVMQQEVSDVVTLIDTGLGNLKIFSKSQLLTYHGTAVYTVDLSAITKDDVELDEEGKKVTVYIPHSRLEPINIQSDDIEYGEVKKGTLAFGKIKTTPEQMAKIQTKAQGMMEKKLEEDKVIDTADRFAKLAVWELFQPMVNNLTTGYSLTVEFR